MYSRSIGLASSRSQAAPGVGGDDDQVAQPGCVDRRAEHRQRVEVVDWHLEEALDLRGVQVEHDGPVGAGRLDGLRADAGPDGDARLVLLVTLGVAEVRDHRGDRRRAGPLQRVDPEQQLDQVVVGREGDALHEEGVPAAHVLQDAHEQVAVREVQRLALGHRHAERRSDVGGKAPTGRPGEQQRVVEHPPTLGRRH
jgi:hypothetical protein